MSESKSLLDPEFVRELETLWRRLEIQARSGGAGERAARRKGGAAEFQEHRQYSPGDDLRRVDWLAFARTGEPVIKLFRSEEDVVVRLLVDCSASLSFGDPSKIEVARRIAAAIGYMTVQSSQRVQVIVARPGARQGSSQGSVLDRIGTARRGRAALSDTLRELSDTTPRGSVELSRAVEQVAGLSKRPGLLVVLSDFFDAGPVTGALGRVRAAGHDVCLVQVLAPEEVEPRDEGDLLLVDAETDESVDVTMDPSVIDAYVTRLNALMSELRGWARKYGSSYVRALTTEPLEGVVRRFVARAID